MNYPPKTDAERDAFLQNFAAKIVAHAPTVGVQPLEILSALADSNAFRWALDVLNQQKTDQQQWTAFKNLLRDGPEGASAIAPEPPALPETPTTLILPGIFKRSSRLVARIKAHAAYIVAIGEDLGIVAGVSARTLEEAKPTITLRLVSGGQPEVRWRKSNYDSLEIEVDRDGEGFRFLAIDAHPDYIDTFPLPATPTLWRYRAIYRQRDERVGEWSDTVQIPVHT